MKLGEPLLTVHRLCKSFYGTQVLHDVSFAVKPGSILGLIGENGSGKSTSMNILSGIHRADSGELTFGGAPFAPSNPQEAQGCGIATIHQELNLFPNLSIAENLSLNSFPRIRATPFIDRKALKARALRLQDTIDLRAAPETLVSRLSQGERQLVEIAKAIGMEARLIIFDEPTTSLTTPEIERLFAVIRRLRAQGLGIIYISHNLTDVMQLCDEIVILRDGRVVGAGPADTYPIEGLISRMVGRSIDQLFPVRPETKSATPVLIVEKLTQPSVVHNVSFTLHGGEIVGLAGLLGAGRSETARILFGIDPHLSGRILVGGRELNQSNPIEAMQAGVAFMTEDRRGEGLLMDAPIYDTVALPNLERHATWPIGWIDRAELRRSAADYCRQVGISTPQIETVMARNLSGGNQQKVVLAKWLMRQPRVFILDEPTRGVDVGAKSEIYKLINGMVADGCGVLMISSEIEELIGMCDLILVMKAGEIVASYGRPDFDRERILGSAMGLNRDAAE